MTIAALFLSTSLQFGLPQGLLESLCWVESSHNISAIHEDDGGTDSLGLCQVKFKTAVWLGFTGTEEELMDPATNIYYAAAYLKKQLIRYHYDLPRALTAYNRGNSFHLSHSDYSDKVITQWGLYQNEQRKQFERIFIVDISTTYGH